MKAAEIPGNTVFGIWRGVSSLLTCRVFVATEYGFGQALGNPQPSPSRKDLEYRSVTVEFVIVAEVIRLPAAERTGRAEPLGPLRSLIKETVPGADSTDFIHRGLQRCRP